MNCISHKWFQIAFPQSIPLAALPLVFAGPPLNLRLPRNNPASYAGHLHTDGPHSKRARWQKQLTLSCIFAVSSAVSLCATFSCSCLACRAALNMACSSAFCRAYSSTCALTSSYKEKWQNLSLTEFAGSPHESDTGRPSSSTEKRRLFTQTIMSTEEKELRDSQSCLRWTANVRFALMFSCENEYIKEDSAKWFWSLMLTKNYLFFTKKLRKDKGKRGINMVTWSLPPFAVNVILSLSNVKRKRTWSTTGKLK